MSDTLEISLLGKVYRVACTDDERESLLAAIALLERKLAQFGGKTRGSNERLAVMAALDLAHELTVMKYSPAGASAALESETIQRRIDSIEARIAAALDQHQSLF